MTTQTKKVDVASIMAKAKEKTKEVKKATEIVQSKTDNYRILPGFKKYEFNGIVVRSISTKNIQCLKTGTNKYQLFNDNGTRKLITKEEISLLFPKENLSQKLKNINNAKPLIKEISIEKINELQNKESIKKIIDSEDFKHYKHYKMHLDGLTTQEIMSLTNTPYNAVKRNIWFYTSGKKKC